MGKRKRKDCSDSDILRKIRRLERKLERSKDRNTRSETRSRSPMLSDQYDNLDEERNSPDIQTYLSEDDCLDENIREPIMPSVVNKASATIHEVPGTSSTLGQIPMPTLLSIPETAMQPQTCNEVPHEILEMLGHAKNLEEKLGDKIPQEISERWGKILLDGLDKEQKDALKEKLLIPENFLLVRAPKLNPEVCAVLSEPAKNRDKRLEYSQNQLGCGIAGLVYLTKDLIQSDVPKLDIIKKLSEVSQILLNLHYEETVNRRKLLLPLLDKGFWNTTRGVKRETYLFGDKLGDTIKNSKDIERAGQQIKKPSNSQNKSHRNSSSGNSRYPPRQPTAKAAAVQNRYYEPRFTRRSANPSQSTRQHKPPPPPPPPPSKPRDRRRL